MISEYPIPWKIRMMPEGPRVGIYDANDRLIVFDSPEDVMDAIVRAVNAHESLVDACRASLDSSASADGGPCRCGACNMARKAIAIAEGNIP